MALSLRSFVCQDETHQPQSLAKNLTIPFEDLGVGGSTVPRSDDVYLVDYIQKYFILKPEHYKVSLER